MMGNLDILFVVLFGKPFLFNVDILVTTNELKLIIGQAEPSSSPSLTQLDMSYNVHSKHDPSLLNYDLTQASLFKYFLLFVFPNTN